MANWSSTSESGILRKRVQKERHEELLVFGYACKLFRDDVKALYIDQGKHLIPWMGDDSLKIDRYDCRGALSELHQFEAEGYCMNRNSSLSESEKRLELLCDEERYFSLLNNEDELEMYKEEEIKRLHLKGTEVQYNYDVPVEPEKLQEAATAEDEAYVPVPELQIPADIELPETVKIHARIEKTAVFISKQGPQMEILIKTKQADNPQFKFLNKDDRLHKYYQYLLSAIKSGQYKVCSENADQSENKKLEEVYEEEESGDHYLHPSLLTTSSQPAPPPLPAVPYKPSADCKYSQLVNRIQGNVQTESPPQPPPPPDAPPLTYEQQQQYYQQYYYAAQYYEYYKHMTQHFQDMAPDNKNTDAFQNQMYGTAALYAQYLQPNNPYAQIVSNLSQNAPQPPANTTEVAKAPIIYKQEEIEKPLLSLAQYGSDSDNDNPSGDETSVKIPPNETEQIISKMASYVVKNGMDFENIVKSKGDSRFQFLNDNHEYHPYYRLRVRKYQSENKPKNEDHAKTKEKKIITPVSFSIKKSKEETQKEIKSALPVEESDEEAQNPDETPVPDNISLTPPPRIVKTPTPPPPSSVENTTASIETANEDFDKTDELILEMIDLTEDIEDKRETKRAEDRKKDKIASVAREKLALQLERKRKAAAFLKMKSGKPAAPPDDEVVVKKRNQKTEVEVLKIEDSESEEGEIKKHKKSSKKKKSHKRKHSKVAHESKSRHKTKEHKRAKKKRKRSHSRSSKSSAASQ